MTKYIKKAEKFFENIRAINGVKEKRCTQHEINFPNESSWFPETIEYFYLRNKSHPEKGFNAECKECSKKSSAKRQKENKDKKRIYDKRHDSKPERKEKHRLLRIKQKENGYHDEYLNKHPEKIKQYAQKHRNHDITNNEWSACKDFFKDENNEWCCAYCGMTEKEHKEKYGEQLHKDHTDHNGINDVSNCIPACKTCNSHKHQEDMEIWFRKQDTFTEDRLTKINLWNNEEYKKYIEPKPPYRITRKQNEGLKTYHWELWTVDERRDFVECVATAEKKDGLKPFIHSIFKI